MKKSLLFVMGIAVLPSLAVAGEVEEKPTDKMLTIQEVTVEANFLRPETSPLSLSTIRPADVTRHTASPNFVEMLQSLPGVYATPSTGSFGDASLNMRGFKQENIAVLLNGIPIQGLTSGSMYWNNWMSLTDATYAVQVQKGIGGSMLADCAMGGTVNIITQRPASRPSSRFNVSVTEQGLHKEVASFSSGRLARGWSITGMLSHVGGDGYVECTDVNTWAYMLSASKQLDERNLLIFTALGSPEKHNQRNTELSSAEVEKYGSNYSKNWGRLRGKPFSIARNHYVKPYFTMQHLFDSGKWQMRNSLYLAIADGGGYSTISAEKGKTVLSFQTPDGHIDFDAVQASNATQQDEQGKRVGKYAMIDYLSGHLQAGGVASGCYQVSPVWKFSAGVQYQYYDTWYKMKMLDLLAADYLLYRGGRYGLGDYVGSRYGRTTHHVSGYVQANHERRAFSSNLGVAVYSGTYRRHDDATGKHSRWVSGCGFSVRGGLVWHLSQSHALYGNLGYNSRLPYAGIYLASSDLTVTNNVTNEKNLLTEMGWRTRWKGGRAEISGYLASWRNKHLTVNQAKRANENAEKYQISGLNALHVGVEATATQEITRWLNLNAYAMLASWKWKSGGHAITYDTYSGEVLKQYAIYCDGLHVGDAPQTQLGLQVNVSARGWYVNADCRYNARMYADFEPSSRVSSDRRDAYRLPAYAIVNATAGYKFPVRKVSLNFFATVRNLTANQYIERGIDGANHDLDTFRGYWGMPRQFSFGVEVRL